MNFSTRELVTMTVFGALWGAVEISLGSLLHAVNLPFSGSFLAAAGLVIALMARLFVPRRGSTLYVGVVAMILKLFSIGSVLVGPMIGIMAEAIIAEVVLSISGRPRRMSFILAGAAGVSWTLVQPFVTGLLLFGRELFIVWLDLLDSGARLLGLDSTSAVFWIVAILVILHLIIGAAAGWLAWDAGRLLQARLGHSGLVSQL